MYVLLAVMFLLPAKAVEAHPLLPYGAHIVGITTSQEIVIKLRQSWPWYVTRGAGLTAAALLVLLMISGIGLVTGLTYRVLEPMTAWGVHRAFAIAFAVSGFIHVFALSFDKYVGFSIAQLLLPYTSRYDPVTIAGHNIGPLYVALGVYSMYIGVILVWTSLVWIEKKSRAWRVLHYLAYLLILMVFIHALFLGTDLKHGFFRALWIFFGVCILLAIFARLRRARTISRVHGKQ